MTETSYLVWSRDTFQSRIAPRIATAVPLLDAECGPGPGAGQYRLFPGALFLLWTGAIGGVFPPGLMLGTVTRAAMGGDGLFQTGEVKLDERLGSLTEVTVLVPLNAQ